MNKRLIASMSCAALLLSSMSLAVEANSTKMTNVVDVVAAATTATPTPSTPETPATPSTPSTPAKPATPTQVVGNATEITRLLALNSVGNDVSLLQALLISNGYVLKVDGIYGVKTLAAVEGFQGKNGLRVDGIVGPKTLAKLAPVVEEKPAEPVTPVVPVEPAAEEEVVVVDVVTSASKVVKADDIEKALSKDGTWMAYLTSDITTDKDLVIDGNFTNKEKTARKLALYNYVTPGEKLPIDEYTLTAKSLTVKSANAKIQNGKFVGDIYVAAPNFQFVDVDVVGNVYYANEEIKTSTIIDEKTTITGKQEVLEVDTVSSASRVYVESDLERAFGKDGKWIVTLQDNITTDKELSLETTFANKNLPARKIALYDQDSNKKSISEFTLTAPKLTVKSTNARIQKGKFVGDIYVVAPGFQLVDADVEGNIYFARQEFFDSFNMDEASTLTGKQEVMEVDALSSASRVYTEADLERALGKDGEWIVVLHDNITTEKELVLDGEKTNRDLPARKIALYDQNSAKATTVELTLTAPKLTIKSPSARIQHGKFVGDIYVEAPNFQLVHADVEGNIYFLNEEAEKTFSMDENSTLTGVKKLVK